MTFLLFFLLFNVIYLKKYFLLGELRTKCFYSMTKVCFFLPCF